ncbi:MAG: hypothetical protein H6667_12280 [Ardenticatenaceae bacterium]|nr:hypothetical protein [Ardenticatenaceae bacterium]MCB9443588.1 hypothetical protein [Ardenticatenaceae bacterium]
MKWQLIEKKEEGGIKIPSNWLYPHYYEALNALFRIENALRVFVYIVLKNAFKDKWLGINIMSDDAAETTIGKIAKQRMNQTKRFGYLGYLVPCPLMYLTGGELIRLITSDSYWKYFNAYFPGSKEIINNKLDEISSVRNALAHFRPIKSDDLDLVKQNAKHVMSKIETRLIDIMGCANIVPTNTKDAWYRELKTLGSDHCLFSFHQSDDEVWIRISFEYSCPILHTKTGRGYRRYRVLNINTPAILHSFSELNSLLIFMYEQVEFPEMIDDSPKFKKSAEMVFSRAILTTEYKNLKVQLENLLLLIAEETGLIQDDNLARGEIIQAVDTGADLKDYGEGHKYWHFSYNNLRCRTTESDPPEYWGELSYSSEDYITSTNIYPWMPVDVSEDEIPF